MRRLTGKLRCKKTLVGLAQHIISRSSLATSHQAHLAQDNDPRRVSLRSSSRSPEPAGAAGQSTIWKHSAINSRGDSHQVERHGETRHVEGRRL